MSPGCATRLTCADGTRAFVKAVGAELNPDTPGLFRREIGVLDHLGEHELWARLLASYDDGAWVALLIEDVEGRHPDFARPRELAGGAGRRPTGSPTVLQERDVPAIGRPGRRRPRASASGPTASTPSPMRPPRRPCPDWLRTDPHGWADVLREHAARPMPHVAHWDIRVDNLLRRPGGEVVFVDWGMAARGPAWVDPLLARLERVDEPWFDDLDRRLPRARARSATTPSRPSSPGSGRTSRCARWSRSTSTCPRSTISGSGSRGGCWRPWPDAPGAERWSTYVGRPPAPRQAIWAPARRGGSVSHCMSGTRPSPC